MLLKRSSTEAATLLWNGRATTGTGINRKCSDSSKCPWHGAVSWQLDVLTDCKSLMGNTSASSLRSTGGLSPPCQVCKIPLASDAPKDTHTSALEATSPSSRATTHNVWPIATTGPLPLVRPVPRHATLCTTYMEWCLDSRGVTMQDPWSLQLGPWLHLLLRLRALHVRLCLHQQNHPWWTQS